MNWPYLSGAFILGLLSSFHCVGMCGPLALSLPTGNLSSFAKKKALIFYQTGRIGTYALLGLILGIAGRTIYLSGFQQYFSVLAGTIILLMMLHYFILQRFWQPRMINRFYEGVRKIIFRLWNSPRKGKFIFLGMANGLLPCGMVYMALAAAMVSNRIPDSFLFMIVFGLGTMPAWIGITYAGNLMHIKNRILLRKATPVLMAFVGLLLILRGMNLGIPFISPLLPHAQGAAVICK